MYKNKSLIKQLVKIELKSILRTKYLKYMLLYQYVLMIPLIFIMLGEFNKDSGYSTFFACFLSAFSIMGLCPYIFAKDGYFYQSFVTRNIPVYIYLKVKIMVLLIFSIFYYLCVLPFILLSDPVVIKYFFISTLYYMGFGGFLMILYSSIDIFKIYLNQAHFLKYDGFSILRIVLTAPVTFPLFFWESTRNLGIWGTAILGFIGLIMHKSFIKWICNNLQRKKYEMLYDAD